MNVHCASIGSGIVQLCSNVHLSTGNVNGQACVVEMCKNKCSGNVNVQARSLVWWECSNVQTCVVELCKRGH